jgi:hypothetical protein
MDGLEFSNERLVSWGGGVIHHPVNMPLVAGPQYGVGSGGSAGGGIGGAVSSSPGGTAASAENKLYTRVKEMEAVICRLNGELERAYDRVTALNIALLEAAQQNIALRGDLVEADKEITLLKSIQLEKAAKPESRAEEGSVTMARAIGRTRGLPDPQVPNQVFWFRLP